ncbi:Uncharacterised protein [Vibrio cholerae]|nr:Uncharacterised protein [Vibrio cholerae]
MCLAQRVLGFDPFSNFRMQFGGALHHLKFKLLLGLLLQLLDLPLTQLPVMPQLKTQIHNRKQHAENNH